MREGERKIEITSHSSKLTNQRLAYIFFDIDKWNQVCYQNPNLPNIEGYFSSIYTLYNNVFSIFNPEENKKIIPLFKQFFSIYFKIKTSEKADPRILFYMLFILDRINRLIKAFLQKRKYFFKLSAQKVTGVDETLKVLEEGGAFFGGFKRVRRIPEDTNEPEPKKH